MSRVETVAAENGRLAARVETLERQAGEDVLELIEAALVGQSLQEGAGEAAGPGLGRGASALRVAAGHRYIAGG